VLDGFFPLNEAREGAKRARAGIVEFGLPYASDPAITRHLADFLRQHARRRARRSASTRRRRPSTLPVPDTLLLNGGVFRGAPLAQRLADTLSAWRGEPVRVLHNLDPDVAVARGAVAYSLARQGLAPAIESGSARSYFLLLDDRAGRRLRAVCLLPRGAQPGIEVRLAERSFALRLGRPVRFHLVSPPADPQGRPPRPATWSSWTRPRSCACRPSPPCCARKAATKTEIPVQLAASLSEVGTLEVHCVAEDGSGQRWKLEFQLRGAEDDAQDDEGGRRPAARPRRRHAAHRPHLRQPQPAGREPRSAPAARQPRTPARIARALGDAAAAPPVRRPDGARQGPAPLAEHERVWLNLAGWCLRPGFGHPLDEWRIEQLWALFDTGVQYHKDSQVRAEWWTLWRRVAGGLSTEAQLRLLDDFAFNLQAEPAERAKRPVTLVDGSEDDMLRLGASLERIPSAYKVEIGDWMLQQIMAIPPAPSRTRRTAATYARFVGPGRVGARQSLHPARTKWRPSRRPSAGWKSSAAGLEAHRAGRLRRRPHRAQDRRPLARHRRALRQQVLHKLAASGAPASWAAMVREVVELDQASATRMFGDALPPGLEAAALHTSTVQYTYLNYRKNI
jgi:hypothetical protein